MKLIRSPILCFCICLATAPSFFFFFNDTATTEIYTLSLHDALPISRVGARRVSQAGRLKGPGAGVRSPRLGIDRKSTRLNSSHSQISYAVFCLKKKREIKLFNEFPSCRLTISSYSLGIRCPLIFSTG